MPEPHLPLLADSDFNPSSYVNHTVQNVFEGISELEKELSELVDVRSVPERYRGQTPSNHKSAFDLLRHLQSYPQRMRDVVKIRCEEATDEDQLVMTLQNDARVILSCARWIREWFGSAGVDQIPVAIRREVDASFARHGLRNIVTIIAAGPPDEIDIRLEDVRDSFLLPREPKDQHDELFTVLRIPTHAARAPHRWSIVLGHEVGHHRLREENSRWLDINRKEGFDRPEGVPKTVMHDNEPLSGTLLLWQVEIIEKFPFTKVRDEIEQQAQHARPSGRLHVDERDGRRDPIDRPTHKHSEAAVDNAIIQRILVANDWLTEIICDLMMVRAYGPAAVASMADHLIMTNSMRPASPTHPPGAVRLAFMMNFLTREDLGVLACVLDPFRAPSYESDSARTDPAASQLIDYLVALEPTIFGFVDSLKLPTYAIKDPERQQAVVCAVNQLAWGVPPHAASFDAFKDSGVDLGVDYASDLVTLTVEDLLNASCLARVLQSNEAILDRVPIDRLTLKAIETLQTLALADKGAAAADFTPFNPPDPLPVISEPNLAKAILSADDISRRFVAARTSERLVITPNTVGKEIKNPSIDLRLGTRFITFHRSSIASFDAVMNDRPRAVQREHEISLEQPFVLHPGEVVLASALEYVALPYNVAAQVITRSSYGRLGLITATAVQVHPYYRGCLTLELVNLGNVPLALYPGEQVAQLIFFAVGNGDSHAPLQPEPGIVGGSFVCPTGPEFPDVRLEKDPWLMRLRAGQQLPTG